MPIFSKVFWPPIMLVILYTIKPISKKKIGRRTHRLRRVPGILLFFEILLTQKSTRLPLGQRFPQNHLPLKGTAQKNCGKNEQHEVPKCRIPEPSYGNDKDKNSQVRCYFKQVKSTSIFPFFKFLS